MQVEHRRRQGIYWLLTIPHHEFTPYLPPGLAYCRGQLELGELGFLHWQILAVFCKKESLIGVRKIFGNAHAELSRSSASTDYVWKEETRIDGTQFEVGTQPFRRNSPTDWTAVLAIARTGSLEGIPPDVTIRCYNQLRRIGYDSVRPLPMVRTCSVFWGATGTGKSRLAWEEAGLEAYAKDPRTKWWDGYNGENHCVIDEFRGTIDVAHILRWLDRYPVRVEVKGGALPLSVSRIWITSNLDPRVWYPDLDAETLSALLRRINVTHFDQL